SAVPGRSAAGPADQPAHCDLRQHHGGHGPGRSPRNGLRPNACSGQWPALRWRGLNFVPTNLVRRLDIVTGGASAAYGSGAVAGVVNIILDDKLEGLTLGADTGVSSRGDGMRYGIEGSFGALFAGGNGHVM